MPLTVSAAVRQLSDGNSQGTQLGLVTNAAGLPDKVGLYGATPVIQPVATGTAGGFTANAGTAANSLSTWTGATGVSAYSIGDIVTALKALGALTL